MADIVEHHRSEIEALCRQYGVRRLEVFGSAITSAFDPGSSDVDFLVDMDEDAEGFSLFARYFGLKEALESLFGRHVDLLMAGALRNPYLVASIDKSRRLVYAGQVGKAA